MDTDDAKPDGAVPEPPSASDAGPAAPRVPPRWEQRDAWGSVAALKESPVLVPAADWPGGLAGLDRPGLYAYWVDEAGAATLSRNLGLDLAAGRVWAGQAGATRWPSGRSNADTLGRRIGEIDLGGRVRQSTLRWTLASVLLEELGIEMQAAMLITPSSEAALTAWMRAHLSVAAHPVDDRDALEGLAHELLLLLDPPLNVSGLDATPLRRRVVEARRRISRDV